MATLGVVNYGESSPHKLNILQQSPIANSANVDNNNKRQIIFLRKPSAKTVDVAHGNNVLASSSPKQTRAVTDMTRIHNPPPVAVARRNARERNRVKQVNNGFATLRQHIPTSIASTYESGNGRGSNKKLSKVETLRMAVEYIKSLEKLLSLSEDNGAMTNFTSSQTYGSSTSPVSTQGNLVYTYQTQLDDDETSSVGSAKYPSKSSFHLMNSHMYEDEENMHPSTLEAMDDDLLQESALVNANIKLTDSQNISLLHSIDNNASLSPEMYSEHSLSPAEVESLDSKSFIPVFNVPDQNILPSFSHIGYDRLPQIKSELLSPTMTQTVIDNDMHAASEPQTLCVIRRNDITANQSNMLQDVIWWDQQEQRS